MADVADSFTAEQEELEREAQEQMERAQQNKERRRAALQQSSGGGGLFAEKECVYHVQKSTEEDGALLVLEACSHRIRAAQPAQVAALLAEKLGIDNKVVVCKGSPPVPLVSLEHIGAEEEVRLRPHGDFNFAKWKSQDLRNQAPKKPKPKPKPKASAYIGSTTGQEFTLFIASNGFVHTNKKLDVRARDLGGLCSTLQGALDLPVLPAICLKAVYSKEEAVFIKSLTELRDRAKIQLWPTPGAPVTKAAPTAEPAVEGLGEPISFTLFIRRNHVVTQNRKVVVPAASLNQLIEKLVDVLRIDRWRPSELAVQVGDEKVIADSLEDLNPEKQRIQLCDRASL